MKILNESVSRNIINKLNESSEEVERYRDWLKSTQEEYKTLDKNDPWYRMNYNDILKREKEYLKALKKALAEEKGTFISPLQLTNTIKKLGNMQKYTDQATSVRGFHWYGKGDFNSSAIEVIVNGSYTTDFIYDSYEIKDGDIKIKGLPSSYGAEETLIIHLKDEVAKLDLDLYV